MTRWLDADEAAAWRPFVHLVHLLPQVLDRQLREQAGLPHAHYQVLAVLSDATEQRLPMGELARLTAMSASRLSHAVGALEQRGWVERRPCPTDRRVQWAQLTDAGRELLRATAPGHVEEVRRRVFDALEPGDVAHLERVSRRVLEALER